jgi:hypothetical protein
VHAHAKIGTFIRYQRPAGGYPAKRLINSGGGQIEYGAWWLPSAGIASGAHIRGFWRAPFRGMRHAGRSS